MPRDQSFVALGQFLQKQHQPLVVNQHAPTKLDCASKAKHIWFTIEKEPTQIQWTLAASNVMWRPLPLWGRFRFNFHIIALLEVMDDPGELRAQRQIIPFFSQCQQVVGIDKYSFNFYKN